MKTWILCGILIACAGSAVAEPPAREDVIPPQVWKLLQDGLNEEWAGIWQMRVALIDCDTEMELFSQTVQDTVCPGISVEPESIEGVEDFECTGTYSETQVDFDCTAEEILSDDCTAFYAWNYTASLESSGDSYSADIVINVNYEGSNCEQLEPFCVLTHIDGTKLGPAPAGHCDVPVQPTHWGTIKARY